MTIGSLSKDDGDGNENGKKAIGLDWRNNNFARASRIFVHFFAVVARLLLPWVPEVFSRVRRGASFRRPQADTCSAKGRRHERRSGENKAFCAGHFLRLDRNRKPRMKRLWHPG